MKCVKTEDAVGHVLCHDLTKIVPGVYKGAAFRKGHIVTAEDVPKLLAMGKESLYVWEKQDGFLHEDEAACILRDLCINQGMTASEPREGKIEIKASCDGLFKIDRQKLGGVNSLEEIIIATRHGDFPVKKGDVLGAMRVIPLVIAEEKLKKACDLCGHEAIFEILPFHPMKTALIVTGSEVAKGRIEDAFGPAVKKKLEEYGIRPFIEKIVSDSQEEIMSALSEAVEQGADMIICTGGMSVDPDDKTPGAIKDFGAEVISYGAPVLPGAMFLLSYYRNGGKEIPILGLPGCVMYAKRTIFDLLLPRVVAGDEIAADSLAAYGEGGLCLNCGQCRFPDCGFGK